MLMALSQPACIKKMFLEVLTFESRFAVEMRLKMHQEMIFLEVSKEISSRFIDIFCVVLETIPCRLPMCSPILMTKNLN